MDVVGAIGVALGFAVGLLGHEVAHHKVADALGDKTPRLYRRLTTNPAAHADVLGSYVLPALFTAMILFRAGFIIPPFGWGKRHAIRPAGPRSPKGPTIVTALAGPATTAVIAVAATWVARALGGIVADVAVPIAIVNASLTAFELLPIPGRDGARILGVFLSPAAADKLDELAQYEALFLLVLFMFLGRLALGVLLSSCELLLRAPDCAVVR